MEEIVTQIHLMQQHMVAMPENLATIDVTPKVEEYPEVRITVTNIKDISLDIFKSLPSMAIAKNMSLGEPRL